MEGMKFNQRYRKMMMDLRPTWLSRKNMTSSSKLFVSSSSAIYPFLSF